MTILETDLLQFSSNELLIHNVGSNFRDVLIECLFGDLFVLLSYIDVTEHTGSQIHYSSAGHVVYLLDDLKGVGCWFGVAICP